MTNHEALERAALEGFWTIFLIKAEIPVDFNEFKGISQALLAETRGWC